MCAPQSRPYRLLFGEQGGIGADNSRSGAKPLPPDVFWALACRVTAVMDVLLALGCSLTGGRSASATPQGLIGCRHLSGQSYRADVLVILRRSTSECLAVLSSYFLRRGLPMHGVAACRCGLRWFTVDVEGEASELTRRVGSEVSLYLRIELTAWVFSIEFPPNSPLDPDY